MVWLLSMQGMLEKLPKMANVRRRLLLVGDKMILASAFFCRLPIKVWVSTPMH